MVVAIIMYHMKNLQIIVLVGKNWFTALCHCDRWRSCEREREREREITSLGTMMVSLYIKTILMNNQVMFWMEINNMTKVELCE